MLYPAGRKQQADASTKVPPKVRRFRNAAAFKKCVNTLWGNIPNDVEKCEWWRCSRLSHRPGR